VNIYISSSWKNREQVREIAIKLRETGHEVYDFTDPNCRKTPEIPPEKYPEEFDPDKHNYKAYINKPEWKNAVMENRTAIGSSDLIVLLLPCGIDSHADWAYGVGMGIKSVIIGHPRKGERSPVHHWADRMFDDFAEFYTWMKACEWTEEQDQEMKDAHECGWNNECTMCKDFSYCIAADKMDEGVENGKMV
jgi:hypothetical protein